ncbi:site-specific integrase [Niallia sp. FSL M8-0099]|uniref:site-specific integrase n=1 Tax=Niallia sp. FSL M8-0099 TaxID=2954519 RepID=UPI0030F618C6
MTQIKLNEKLGTYYFVYDAGKDQLTGKRKQIRRSGFKNVTDAKRALKKVMLDAENNDVKSKTIGNVSFQEFASAWLENKKISIQYNTYANTVQNFRNNVYPYIGDILLKNINHDILQEYINELSNKVTVNGNVISSATVERVWKYVKEVLHKAAKKKAFDINELEDLYLPKVTKKINVWGKDDVKKFLSAHETNRILSRHYIGMAITVMTGMRMGEVLGLRWKDISFDKKTITINQTLVLTSGESTYQLVQRTKTSSSKATIAIPSKLIDMLNDHKRVIENDKILCGKMYTNNDLVVCTKYGTPLNPVNFRKLFSNLIKKLELPKIRFHDLRHTHATYLISEGVSPKLVQERLRHSDIKTTLGTYSHVLPQMHIDAIDKFDEMI